MPNNIVSIVVPIYGVEKYIRKCIDSIITQTYSNIEIILVDDGSKDNCSTICDEYARRDSRIKVIHKKNGGLVSARKAGVEAAHGKYIEFVDGDDWISDKIVEKLVSSAEKTNADIVMCSYYEASDKIKIHQLYTPAGVYTGETLTKIIDQRSLYGGSSEPHYQFGIEINVWNKLFRSKLLKDVEDKVPDQISYGEDTACTMSALQKCSTLTIIDTPLYYYRINPESMSKAYSKSQTLNTIPLIIYLRSCFKDNDGLLNQLAYYHISITMANIGNESRAGLKKDLLDRYNKIKVFLKETDFNKSLSEIDRNKLAKNTNMMCSLIEAHLFFLPFMALSMKKSRKATNNE